MTQEQVLTWADVLKRTDLVGGDLENHECGYVFRGPISKIEVQGEMVCFTMAWVGRSRNFGNRFDGEWEKWDGSNSYSINIIEIPPGNIGNARIACSLPFGEIVVIFPKGGSKLDSAKIKGLPKASVRLLALYPDLQFDREAATKVLLARSFSEVAKALSGLPADAKLTDLLATFKHDGSAEEFLWFYIEAVTGEVNVNEKVY